MSAMSVSAASLVGTFTGNDTGAKGTAITELNNLFPSDWALMGKSDEGFGTFLSGGTKTQTGSWATGLTGAGAFSVKAGTGYTLYTTADISVIDWTTLGLLNKGGQQPTLSHLSLYTRTIEPKPTPVPEHASAFVGLVGLAGVGLLKKKA